jgi:hypothetical protein
MCPTYAYTLSKNHSTRRLQQAKKRSHAEKRCLAVIFFFWGGQMQVKTLKEHNKELQEALEAKLVSSAAG